MMNLAVELMGFNFKISYAASRKNNCRPILCSREGRARVVELDMDLSETWSQARICLVGSSPIQSGPCPFSGIWPIAPTPLYVVTIFLTSGLHEHAFFWLNLPLP